MRSICIHKDICSFEEVFLFDRSQQLVRRRGIGHCGGASIPPLARHSLGMAQAKKMIAICTNIREHKEDDSAVSLSVIDGEV